MSVRERVRFWFDDLTTPMGRATDVVIVACIIVACVSAVADTYQLSPGWTRALIRIERIITILFIIEYVLRLWVAERPFRHIFSLYSLIDLVAIIPGLMPGRQTHFQILRIFRVVRIFRLIRFLETDEFFFGTITRLHLYVMRVCFTIMSIPFVSAGLIFSVEQYEGSPFKTFFDAFYYSVVTLTTVGFGDIVPVTSAGRRITLLMIAAGVVFIPWQVKNLIGQLVASREKVFNRCIRCGLDYHERDARFCRKCGSSIIEKNQ